MNLVIVDYGLGNLPSVAKAFRRVGCAAEISGDPERIRRADRLVLPGVGHFARGMANLRAGGLDEALEERVRRQGAPLLAICLGVQLLSRRSEEGDAAGGTTGHAGLGWIAADTVRFALDGKGLRAPHFGWNTIAPSRGFLGDELDAASYYFAHSYHLAACDPAEALATTSYGVDFVSVVQKDNLLGTQFHPEKSHRRGLALLTRFLEMR
jgi:glutamine amidotransferase